jgi:hypothetical protein
MKNSTSSLKVRESIVLVVGTILFFGIVTLVTYLAL